MQYAQKSGAPARWSPEEIHVALEGKEHNTCVCSRILISDQGCMGHTVAKQFAKYMHRYIL